MPKVGERRLRFWQESIRFFICRFEETPDFLLSDERAISKFGLDLILPRSA